MWNLNAVSNLWDGGLPGEEAVASPRGSGLGPGLTPGPVAASATWVTVARPLLHSGPVFSTQNESSLAVPCARTTCVC